MPSVVQIPQLPAATALSGAEQYEAVQAGVSVRVTTQQIKTFVATPTAWATYSPVVSAWIAGSIGTSTAVGRFLTVGNLTNFSIVITLSGTVTATGVFVALPNTSRLINAPLCLGNDSGGGGSFIGIALDSTHVYAETVIGGVFTPVSGHVLTLNGSYENT